MTTKKKYFSWYSPTLFTQGRTDKSQYIPYGASYSEPEYISNKGMRTKSIEFAEWLSKNRYLYDAKGVRVPKKDLHTHRFYGVTVSPTFHETVHKKAAKKAGDYLGKKIYESRGNPYIRIDDPHRVYLDMYAMEATKAARHHRMMRKNKSPLERY